MTIRTLTPPAVEPVSLAEARLYLRVDHDDEDALIGSLIRVARERVEALTGRAMISRTVAETLDAWPEGRSLSLGLAPVSAVSEARTLDEDGALTVFAAEHYYADLSSFPPRLALAGGAAWPGTLRARGGVEIEYVAGYGAAAEDVPETLRQAVLEIAAEAYERGGPQGPLNPATYAALTPYMKARL